MAAGSNKEVTHGVGKRRWTKTQLPAQPVERWSGLAPDVGRLRILRWGWRRLGLGFCSANELVPAGGEHANAPLPTKPPGRITGSCSSGVCVRAGTTPAQDRAIGRACNIGVTTRSRAYPGSFRATCGARDFSGRPAPVQRCSPRHNVACPRGGGRPDSRRRRESTREGAEEAEHGGHVQLPKISPIPGVTFVETMIKLLDL